MSKTQSPKKPIKCQTLVYDMNLLCVLLSFLCVLFELVVCENEYDRHRHQNQNLPEIGNQHF